MSASPSPPGRDCQLDAERNEVAVLAALQKFGHLRLVDLARACWPRSPEKSGYAMARRTLARLESRKYCEFKPNAVGSRSFVLTGRGVLRLSHEGIEASIGTELATAGARFMHHTTGARYLIERAAQGCRVWSEQDIDQSRSPIGRGELKQTWGKVPDGFVAAAGFAPSRASPGALAWVEVEGSRKVGAEVDRILELAQQAGKFLNAAETIRLGQVVVVYDERASMGHEGAMVLGLKRLKAKLKPHEIEHLLGALLFVRCTIDFPFAWKAHEAIGAATVLAMSPERRVHRAKPKIDAGVDVDVDVDAEMAEEDRPSPVRVKPQRPPKSKETVRGIYSDNVGAFVVMYNGERMGEDGLPYDYRAGVKFVFTREEAAQLVELIIAAG